MFVLRSFRYKGVFFIVSVGAVFIAVLAAYILYTSVWRHEAYAVIRTKESFKPQNISIHRGDTVIFSSSQDVPFWPASDNHPIHEIYPAFDPRKALGPGETWQFRFWNVGTWEYHDHLVGPVRGTITVLP